MLLNEYEIQRVLVQAQTAFPNFTEWAYNNEINADYFGFSLWGRYVLDPADPLSPCFFITVDTYEDSWRGYVTTGQPCYLWSSADVGDAHLLSTKPCKTAEDAISALKEEILKLFQAFSSESGLTQYPPQSPRERGEVCNSTQSLFPPLAGG